MRFRLILTVFRLDREQKGTCCEVFRGRGSWRLCSHQYGDESKDTRNLQPGALTLGALNALLFPATTGLLTSFNTFPWNCHFQLWPKRARTRWQLRQRDYQGPASGPIATRERIFRRRAAREVLLPLNEPVRQQRIKSSERVEPEKERGVRFKTRGSRHVSNKT